ncbi:hypothetical protein [Salipiger mangrovisoli]|uniref:Uncharacterized protein n=1 Tax=Salipiger mangrovisoli TaxID=2865933 RepID=A0ABR9XA75_9RHOB|nr:hypothetical protein [Salipiger mangrovisoli]MBE9640519.1 hypothetical protein [Salipiger mangrovisoli]
MRLSLFAFSGAAVLATAATAALIAPSSYALSSTLRTLAAGDMQTALADLRARGPELLLLWCGLLALLLHAPGVLTVRRQRLHFRAPAFLKRLDEAPVPPLVCLAWIIAGLVTSAEGAGFFTGLLYGSLLALGYAMVRAVPVAARRMTTAAEGVPLDEMQMLFARAQTGHYLLRVATAVISFSMLAMALLGTGVPVAIHVATTLVLLVAHLGLAAAAVSTALGLAKAARRTHSFRIQHEVAAAGLMSWIYVSGTAEGYLKRCLGLQRSLAGEGHRAGFLLRDAQARKTVSEGRTALIHCARTLGSLDHFVHAGSGVKTAFYLDDAVRNGHFTRFPEFDHILVASEAMTRAERMPRNFAMYDLVVMPSRAAAQRWRLASDPDLAARIVTVAGGSQAQPPGSLHVHCGRETPEARLAPDLFSRLEGLADEASTLGMTLMLSLPEAPQSTPAERVLADLVRANLGRRATVFDADALVAEELAGISAVTTRAGAARALAEGRTSLWLGAHPAPEGCIGCPPGGLKAALDLLRCVASTSIGDERDFGSYAELLAWRERRAG